MVADHVDIDTLSFQDGASAVHWECDGSTEYAMGDGDWEEVGTMVTLHLNEVGRWAGAAWVVSRALRSPLQRKWVQSIFEIFMPLAHWRVHCGSPETPASGGHPCVGSSPLYGRCQMHRHI